MVNDPDGTPVELTDERWGHILDGHPEVEPYRQQVLAAIGQPTQTLPVVKPTRRGTTSRTAAHLVG